MNFLGLVWIASYVSSLFSPQTLIKTSDYIARVFSAKPNSQASDSGNQSPLDRSTSATAESSTQSPVLNSPIGLKSSRTQIPLVQSFLQPLSWLNGSESILLRPEWIVQSPSFLQFVPPTVETRPTVGRQAKRPLLSLIARLSQWSQSVGQLLRRRFPIVTVTQAQSTEENGVSPDSQIQKPQCTSLQQWNTARNQTAKFRFQVRVKGQLVAELPTQSEAEAIAKRLKEVLFRSKFDPFSLKPAMINGRPAGIAGDQVVFTIDSKLERRLRHTADLVAINWINNLRLALSVPVLTLVEAQTEMYGLAQTEDKLEGTASWYGPYFHGRLTAAGETFDQNELTAAHPSLPFNTYLKVTNLQSGDSVIVRVNDRGPYVGSRSLDLSREAARCLGSENRGVVSYEAVIMQPAPVAIAQKPASPPKISQQVAQGLEQQESQRDN